MSVWLGLVGASAGWLGGAILLLSDRRKGLALGLAVAGAGLGLAEVSRGDPAAGAILAVAGLVSAGLRLRAGPAGWGLVGAGSSPRVILSAVLAGAAAWIGTAQFATHGTRSEGIAVIAVTTLAAGRLLTAVEQTAAFAGASALALGAGGVATLPSSGGSGTGLVGGALAAVLIAFLPVGRPPRGEAGPDAG